MVAPPDKLRIPDGEPLKHVGIAREVLEALAKAPDGELVRVEERDETVVVAKQGRSLHVTVHSSREHVSVNVPLHLALQALPDRDGRIHTAALAASLGGRALHRARERRRRQRQGPGLGLVTGRPPGGA